MNSINSNSSWTAVLITLIGQQHRSTDVHTHNSQLITQNSMFNTLTIDLEDYFQVHAFSDVIKYDDWGKFECRIERNTDRLLSILHHSSMNNCTAALQHSNTSLLDNSSIHSLINSSSDVSAPQHRSTAALSNSITHSLITSQSGSSFRTPDSALRIPIKATFFVLGWLAERYPDLVRRIQKEGHEIACHGYAHKLIYTQTKEEFRQDIRKSKAILEDITGSRVIGYRAPSYSITNKSQWAFEVLVEEGFKYDSSIFPIHHDFYGLPEAPRFPFAIALNGNSNVEFSVLNFEFETAAPQHGTTAALNNLLTHSPNNSASEPQSSVLEASGISEPKHCSTAAHCSIIEFPISTLKIFGQNVPISGGGYFRLFPYSLIRKGLKSINQKENKPFIFYVHPWEFDADQPRIKGAANLSKFRHYVNLDKTESKFRNLLKDFEFTSIREVLRDNSITA